VKQQRDSAYFSSLRYEKLRNDGSYKAREARRTNFTTEQLDMRKYARCEWKCLARSFIVALRFWIKYEITG